MSITKGFENRRLGVPDEEWSEHGTYKYWGDDIERLLKHARALEAMLKKHERLPAHRKLMSPGDCLECGFSDKHGHAHDCQLAKLLEGVE